MTERENMMAAHPGIKFNDSPRLANGERAMFVRILDKKDAKECVDKVRQLNPMAPAYLDKDAAQLCVYAPDGDLVFGMVPTDETTVQEKGRLGPGQMIAIDLQEKRVLHDTEIKNELAAERPFDEWTGRIRAIRANASRLSHEELDECEVLDDGDPEEFGQLNGRLYQRFPHLTVFGGCCGTDHRHVMACSRSIN